MDLVYHGEVNNVDQAPQHEARGEDDPYMRAANTIATIADTLHTEGTRTATEIDVWWGHSEAGEWVQVRRPAHYARGEQPDPGRRHTVIVIRPSGRMRGSADIDPTVSRLILSLVPHGVVPQPPYPTSVEGELVREVDGHTMLDLMDKGGIGAIRSHLTTLTAPRRSTPARAAMLHTLYRQRRQKGWK